MLEEAAAKQWGVDVAEVKAVNHEVLHDGGGQKLGYGDLAEAVAEMAIPAAVDSLAYKDESSSATSARATSRSTTCTTSPPARRSTAPTCGCPA